MENTTVTRIPCPKTILKGNWFGIVYAIETKYDTFDAHFKAVGNAIDVIKDEFDENNHMSVSLKVVKEELVYQNDELGPEMGCFCTLVQFRIRDSY